MVISRYIESNQEQRRSDVPLIDRHAVRVQESLTRLHGSLTRVEVKIDDMSFQLDSLIAEISHAEVNTERREDTAKTERAEIKQEIY